MSYSPVSIIIPYYNDAATIAACVRSVFEHTHHPDWEIIIIDDGSTEGSLDPFRRRENVRIHRQSRGGVARALNAGFRLAGERDVVRLHADVVIETPDWLDQLADAAYSLPKAGIVGVRLIYPDGRIQSEGRSLISGLGFHPQHRHRRAYSPDGPPGKVQEVDSVSGAVAFYRREVIKAVGGLDENYGPAWMEDDDFCIAARFNGFKVWVHPGIRGVHYTRSHPPTFECHVPGKEVVLKQVTASFKNAAERMQAEYWERKWGWHPFHPDLGEIRRLYGQTEICWQIGECLSFNPSSEEPSVDCCFVTWNALPLLRRTLESLATTDYPAERINVYVTDNASTDGTAEYLRDQAKTYPFKLHHLRMSVNTGAPVGLNISFAAGSGALVAKLDDDIVLPPDWLRVMVADIIKRPYAGCIGAKIVNDDDRQTIQCGPYRSFPGIYGHDDEVDVGQADYLARVTHVRGCCNLYRRDAISRCGLLDIRYSPTQYDDMDHHIALLNAGFEVLYDGRVRVVHKLNDGLARTPAAISSQQGNLTKLIGKWGRDVFEVLDCSIDLSREGRYLPDNGDTTAWLAEGPGRAEFPRGASVADPSKRQLISRIYEELGGGGSIRHLLDTLCNDHISLAHARVRDGAPRRGLEIMLVTANFAPLRPDVWENLADIYQRLGLYDMGRTMARRGLHLDPNSARLQELANRRAGPTPSDWTSSLIIQQVDSIGESGVSLADCGDALLGEGGGLKVLIVNTFEPRIPGGDKSQMKKTRQYLQKLGVKVDICCTPRPDPLGYDIIHVWNTWFPHETLTQVKAIRAVAPQMPIALSPIYWSMAEKVWADQAVPSIFATASNIQQLEANLAQLAGGRWTVNGVPRSAAKESCYDLYETYQRTLFGLVDYLLPQSHLEMVNLKKTLGIEMPYTVVYNGAEQGVFDAAKPDWFIQQYGVKDFVLTVGLVEPRKNQLMLLHALRGSDVPVVVVGRHYDRRYYDLCRQYAPKRTLFIDHLPHEQLASAFKAAKVYALPSWVECASLANVEAALSGCALAISDRTSEPEYFGKDAYFCDPASIGSIRAAVITAYKNYEVDAPKRARLIEQFRSRFTWQRAADDTLKGYRATIAQRQGRPTARR